MGPACSVRPSPATRLIPATTSLMRKGGVDTHLAFDVLTNSLFDSGVHKSYGEKIVDGRYSPPGMAAPLAIKDLLLALAEAESTAGRCRPRARP
jgi:3-hydroxyisobutyrate dehydrogenase-like beta-hydroxyacid dehydrogenase